MPLHEYLCARCGKTSEILQAVREKAATICPYCGGKLKKLISAPAIQFKGSGWYVTDYAKKGSAASSSDKADSGEKAAKSESKEKDGGSSGTEAKAEKPEKAEKSEKSEKSNGKSPGKKSKD